MLVNKNFKGLVEPEDTVEESLTVLEVANALGIVATTKQQVIGECHRRRAPELEGTENNGPAIISIIIETLDQSDPEAVADAVKDIDHLARITCAYIAQIKAIHCARWHEVREEYEAKARRKNDGLSAGLFALGSSMMRGSNDL